MLIESFLVLHGVGVKLNLCVSIAVSKSREILRKQLKQLSLRGITFSGGLQPC